MSAPIEVNVNRGVLAPNQNAPQESACLATAQAAWKRLFAAERGHSESNVNREIFLTHSNMKSNVQWGDALEDKGEDIFRVYCANVNGFTLDRMGGQYDMFCRVLKEVQADVSCGQEHNLDTTKAYVRSTLYHTTQQYWQRSRLDFSTTPMEFQRMYKPGGTFVLTVGDTCARVRDRFRDKWGRWTSQSFLGSAGSVITIVSAYQVVTDSPAPGLTTAASQQHSLLIQEQDDVIHPRQAFRRDLQKYLLKCRQAGHEILLVGDFNEEIGCEADGMISVMNALGMIDIMRHHHRTTLPATYARGSRCLDYALATPKVVESVRKSGYEAFNARYTTDHRPYFVDFSVTSLFGTMIQPLSKLEPRILRSNHRQQVTAYIRRKYKILEDHNVFRRIDQLTWLGDRHAFAERLDKDVVEASLAAEKSIQRVGTAPWSVALHKARQKAQILTKCLSMAKTRLNNEAIIRTAWSKAGLANDPPVTEKECTRELKEARQQVRSIISEQYGRRDSERMSRITCLEASTSSKDHAQAKVLRQLHKAEALNRLFGKLRRLQEKSERSGISRIEIPVHPDQDPKTCTEWRQVDVPTEVIEQLRQRNRRHFGQADGTPFTVAPLRDQLGYCGDGPEADHILSGRYKYPAGMDSDVQRVIQHLQISDELASMRVYPTISKEDYVGKLKAWRESTVTSPSRMHLGHYKAMIAKHSYSEILEDESEEHKQQREALTFMQSEILRVHLILMNYALERGYSYMRWRNVANSVLFKEPGNIKIHRTRIIHIYEADYNLMLGLKWRSALLQAEAYDQLNSGQYGSRPKRTAIDPVFLEELQLEMSRITRKTMILTNYDATACYDRIIPNLAMLASRRFGVPREVTLSNARTLEHTDYRIRTELGLATEGYQHTSDQPIYGTGQGSGNSPVIWCFLSSILYDCYDEVAFKAAYLSPNRERRTELGMIGFVDDSNGQTNAFEDPETIHTPKQILQKMKANATAWSRLLAVSGGSLELSKCSYHVLTWKFTASGSPVLYNDRENYGTVTVPDALAGEDQELQYLSTYEAHKTLGHYKEPAGTQRVQFKKLQDKSKELTSFLWSTNLTREESWTFYFATYLPSMSYPLANSHFTERQLTQIQRKAMSIIFAKCGYNRNMKREILYGPLEYGGSNFRRLYDQQGIGQIRLFLRHWRSNTPVGDMLRILLEWCQYAAGISISILEDVTTPLPHLDSKWIASLRHYLANIRASIHVDSGIVPHLEREHDSFIMDWVVHSGKFTAGEIRRINYCRLFLQVVTISDLVTVDGTYLDLSKVEGAPSLQSSRTRWIQIHQDKPSTPTWKLWKKANRLWSNSSGKLLQPLGPFLRDHRARRMEYFSYGYRNKVAIRTVDGYVECLNTTNGKLKETGKLLSYNHLPRSAAPVAVRMLEASDEWELLSKATQRTEKPSLPIPRTFEQFIAQLDPWEEDLLRYTSTSYDPRMTVLELQDGFFAGCDGSSKHNTQGAFGWMISAPTGERMASGNGPSRGATVDSYRAECSGMLAILRFLIRLAEYSEMFGEWTGTIGTDSQSLLDRLFGKQKEGQEPLEYVATHLQPLDVLTPEWDLLIEIQASLRRLPDIRLQYVKGHQDNDTPYQRLSLMSQLNVDADKLATRYQEEFGMSRPHVLMSPNAGAYLLLNDGMVTANFDAVIRYAATAPGLREYIKVKNHWNETIMRHINWDAHAKAMKSSIKRRIHFSKLVHDCLPTHSMRNRIDSGKRTCPLCSCDRETRDHVIRCPAEARSNWRRELFTRLNTFHDQEKTSPLIRHLLQEALLQWLQSEDNMTVSPIFYPTELREIIIQQNVIGWRQIFNGRFSNEWSIRQEAYYRRVVPKKHGTKAQRTGARWQRQLILVIWEWWYELWKSRNADVHGVDKQTHAVAERREVNRRLEEIYDQRHQLEPQIQHLLLPTLQDHAQRPTWVNQNWLAVNAQILRDNWKQYWEDLFAPKAQYASTGVRSLIPLQNNNIGYFLTLASCPADGYPAADPHDPGHAFYDAAAVLKYSIFSNTYPAKSKYNATMYAIVHPAAVVCKGPNHEPYDRVKVLQDLGYKVTILGSPVIKANMKGYVKNNIDSDAGDRDFMRIQGFTYDHHPAVVLVDFTTLVLKPLDNIFDNFLKDTKKKIIFTYDYPDKLPNTGKNSGMSSHFVIAKPSAQFFQTLTDAYKNINFSPTMGWNWQGIKDFKGALGTKGFFVHYFTRVEAGVNDVLSRCVFGSDASNPRAMDPSGNVVCRDPLDCRDCRYFDFKSMKVIKMIHTCGKPWECHYDDAWDAATKTACEGFHRAWFSARVDFEQSCWSNGPPSFRNGAFKPDVFMGFCACSGITCYDRMIDDKSAPSVCDKDTQTSVGVGRITFPNGAYQDQKLSLTTGQVTGSSTACMSGKISLDGYDPPYNLGIVIDVSGSTGGPFAGSVVGDVNSDGEYNTILDAEIAAIIAVLEDIAASPGLGNDNVSIGLTTFSTNAEYLGIFTPCEPSDPSKVNAALLTKLKALRSSGFTHFDDALDKTITFYEQAPKNRNNLLMFLSDGVPNVVGDGDKEEPTNTYEDNQPGTMEYASELAILDSFKVKRIAVGVGAKSDVGEGFGLDMIDNTPDPYTNKGPTLATTTDALKGALLNSPLGGVLLDFKVSVNGAVQSNIDESHVKSGPTGFTYGRFVVSGLDPHNGAINEISVTATVDYDGLLATTNDQVILTTFNIIPGTLL